jgi:hypothetical protein
MNYTVATYAFYFLISVALTAWVARTLHKKWTRLSRRCLPR